MSQKESLPRKRSRLHMLGRTALWVLLVAICIVLVRQVWFELYQIPTGSMRPTFREQDHVLVSKTAFGINWPFRTKQLYFDSSLVHRGDVVVWSGEGIDLPETSTRRIGPLHFPHRYIKRVMAKGGDTLYFYGGKLYGMDANGKDISPELQRPFIEKNLEYLPFSHFEGRLDAEPMEGSAVVDQIYLKHMGQRIARLKLGRFGQIHGSIFDGQAWVTDEFAIAAQPHDSIRTFTDFWGMGNFAMARLLTKEQVLDLTGIHPDSVGDAIVYLELRHHPNLVSPPPQFHNRSNGQMRLVLTPQISLIPLAPEHLKRLMKTMNTSRFVVQDGRAAPYSKAGSQLSASSPLFNKIPDGTYEIIDGIAYSVDWGGRLTRLPEYHPLYRTTPTHIQRLFNLGIEVDNDYAPRRRDQTQFPARYAYFRHGDLYLMGQLFLSKDAPTLQNFTQRERNKARQAPATQPYPAFIDYGPPLDSDGSLDKRRLHTFGLKVPQNHYLMLGDNHARSADSRTFGFVPQANLRGQPHLLLWPTGSRWGLLTTPSEKSVSTPTLLLLILGLSSLLISITQKRYKIFNKNN